MSDIEKVIRCKDCYYYGGNGFCFRSGICLKTNDEWFCAEAERKRGREVEKIDKPLNYMGYEVTTIEDPELGSFHYDKHHNLIDWKSADRLDELSVPVDTLKLFLKKAEEIFAILGVDVND
jgi:hypothetical protein